jgi:YqaJ-like viral recombinase domain
MIVHGDLIQGSTEWLRLRAGIPTASCFDCLITPKGKPSTSAERYLHELLAERILGRPLTGPVTTWMDRGARSEAEAVAYYESLRDLDTTKVGFVTNDAGTIGASPDRLVGDDGLLEIKVPKEHTHVSYLLGGGIAEKYCPQLQGQLWITGRAWIDSVSYHPEMPPSIVRVSRDEDYIRKLEASVTAFSQALEDLAVAARDRGWIR